MEISKIQRMKCGKGLTLIELLIVIVIVGVLAAIAIPTYSNYMIRARRADAKTALEQLRASQEMFRAERGRYANDGDDPPDAITVLRNTWGAPGATVGDYNITMVATSTTYIGTAAAFTSRQSEDTTVPLTINQDAVKTPANKWAK
jgi:type IV pilus assembly protein PilE